jgi:hypothetical protein
MCPVHHNTLATTKERRTVREDGNITAPVLKPPLLET